MKSYKEYNNDLLIRLSSFLNYNADIITKAQIKSVMDCGVSEHQACRLLLLSYLEIEDKYFIHEYFDNLLHHLDASDYLNNPYMQRIHFPNLEKGKWVFKESRYKPFEMFVMDDFKYEGEKIIPQLGYFNEDFVYPCVYENNVLWMSITPNEINTMKKPLEEAKGNVLTFGLGLGYYAYMVSLKENVCSVTIVERDENVISLFEKYILPQFENKRKIKIIKADAYDYLSKMEDNVFDYVFVDIYHDAGDGKEVYLKFQNDVGKLKNTRFGFWVYETIKAYL